MKTNNNKYDVKKIYDNLKSGFVYSDGFHGFYYEPAKITKCGYALICYNHRGSSAVRATQKDLKWLIETIFDNDISSLQVKAGLYVNTI